LIPRGFVRNHLKELGSEFEELNRILGPFAEISTGSRPAIDVRSISASSFGVFLKLTVATAAAVASALESIVKVYKTVAEFKRLRSEMLNLGMPKAALKSVDTEAAETMGRRIGELVDELMTTYNTYPRDGRQNELKVDLKLSLNSLANRIDAGFNIEVRTNPPSLSDNATEDQKRAAEGFATIQAAQENLKFMNHDDSPMLSLPERKSELKSESAKLKPAAEKLTKEHGEDRPVGETKPQKKKSAPKRSRKKKAAGQ
jgi:hypothetical protein